MSQYVTISIFLLGFALGAWLMSDSHFDESTDKLWAV